MKRFLKLLVMAGLVLLFPMMAHAEGAITADEQRILDALNQGVTANGQTFYFDATDIQQAENDLKSYDYSKSTVDQVVGNINAARQLVMDNAGNIQANSLNDLLKQLPRDVQKQVGYYVAATWKALDARMDENGKVVTNTKNQTNTVYVPTNGKNPIVKTTGGNYTMFYVVLAGLAASTLGLAVLQSRKWSTINA
ncbi:hypothetical protein [Vagococcus silagei]|uniref:LPXTG cell wall anchor domain-containing protein n=1 Tax=Vagococcus silagei TaxID=2508885 RepID=A0A4S3B7M8_9ENTE|nr:hypothetical protein [Vagococcus silagei]THB60755.1 hypothetical protein ESZ54_09205 [Vagococcus silagei]